MTDTSTNTNFQAERNLKIKVSGFNTDEILLNSIKGEEGVSKLFSYRLDLWCSKMLKSEEILGKEVTVTLAGEQTRYFNGIISSFNINYCKQLQVNVGDREMLYHNCEVILSPKLWLLTQNRKYRIFHHKTSLEIVREILKDWAVSFVDSKLSTLDQAKFFPKLEHCAQYGESDFDFISRLLEQEGIFYYFVHGSGDKVTSFKHEMILLREVSRTQEVLFCDISIAEGSKGIKNWRMEESIVSQKRNYNDYNFASFKDSYQNVAETTQKTFLDDKAKKEMVTNDYQAGFRFVDDKNIAECFKHYGKNMLEVDSATERISARNWRGELKSDLLFAGALFNFNDQAYRASNGYFIRELEFKAQTTPYRSGQMKVTSDSSFNYHASFKAHDIAENYFAPKTVEKPRVHSQQRAVVSNIQETGNHPQVYVDKYVRVMVEFIHWNITKKAEGSTSPAAKPVQDQNAKRYMARVANNWAGNTSGMFNLPREGQEVLLSFVNGDPDDPVVTGAVYNNVNPAPVDYTKIQNKYSTVLRSQAVFENETLVKAGATPGNLNITDNKSPSEMKIWDLDKPANRKNFSEIGIYSVCDENFKHNSAGAMDYVKGGLGLFHVPFLSNVAKMITSETDHALKQKSKKSKFKEGINFYSNHSILSQATQNHTVKAGSNIVLEAGKSLTLKVGRSSMTLTDETIKIKHEHSFIPASVVDNNMDIIKYCVVPSFNSSLTFDDKNLSGKALHVKHQGYLANYNGTNFGAKMMMHSSMSIIKGSPVKLKAGIHISTIIKHFAGLVNQVTDFTTKKLSKQAGGYVAPPIKMLTGIAGDVADILHADGNKTKYFTKRFTHLCLESEILMAYVEFIKGALKCLHNSSIVMEPEEIEMKSASVKVRGQEVRTCGDPLAGTLMDEITDGDELLDGIRAELTETFAAGQTINSITIDQHAAQRSRTSLTSDDASGSDESGHVSDEDVSGSDDDFRVLNEDGSVLEKETAVTIDCGAAARVENSLARTAANATSGAVEGARGDREVAKDTGASVNSEHA